MKKTKNLNELDLKIQKFKNEIKRKKEREKKALNKKIEKLGKSQAYNVNKVLSTFNIKGKVVTKNGKTDTETLKRPIKVKIKDTIEIGDEIVKIKGVRPYIRKSKNLMTQFNKLRKQIIQEIKINRENDIRERIIKEAKALGKRPVLNEELIRKQARLSRREYELLSFKKIYSEGINIYTGQYGAYGEPLTKVIKGKAAIKHKIESWTRNSPEVKKSRFLQTYKHYGDQRFKGNPIWEDILREIAKLSPDDLNSKIANGKVQIQDPYTIDLEQLLVMYWKLTGKEWKSKK